MERFLRSGDRDGLVLSTYIHDEDSRGVEFLDDPFRRNTDRRHEESGLLLHDKTRRMMLSTQIVGVREGGQTHFDNNVD